MKSTDGNEYEENLCNRHLSLLLATVAKYKRKGKLPNAVCI